MLVCPKCNTFSTASDWDDSTMALCVNRTQRRRYTPILRAQHSKYYKCPKCAEIINIANIRKDTSL